MKSIFGALAVFSVAMLLIAGAVFGLNDSTVLVPPPESVAEGFARALVAGRYDRALPYLSEDLAAEVGADGLRALAGQLKSRTGVVLNVQGEPGWMAQDSAEAAATLQTESAGYVRLTLPMSREHGVWSISSLEGLERETVPAA
ncbi:MAG TPA: hypothetical protein VF131_08765 [Blastocatellia bacterium]|nr:hypothetical protein [Blastocatellia bacterium]